MEFTQNCEGCKYRENNDSCTKLVKNIGGKSVLCSDSDSGNCISIACPEKCYLPYPKNFYDEDISNMYYDSSGKILDTKLESIKNDISMTNEFKENLSKRDNVKDLYSGVYNSDDLDQKQLSDQFKCGSLIDNKPFPGPPSKDELQNFLDGSDNLKQTLWDKIKVTTSNTLLNQTMIDSLNAYFSNIVDSDGVDVNQLFTDLTSTDSSGLNDLDDPDFKEYANKLLQRFGFPNTDRKINEIYNDTVGKLKKMLEEEIVNCDDGDDSCPIRIIYDSLYDDDSRMLSENIITEWANKKILEMTIKGEKSQVEPLRLIDIFMISEDDNSNFDLETRLNYLMDTGIDPDKEKEIIQRIGNYKSIEELGMNPIDVEFIEKKIKKFLGVSTDDLVDCFMLSNVSYDDICNTGFSDRPMKILGNLMNIQADDTNIQNNLYEEKLVIRKLLKYIPSIMRKILEISEKVEMSRCDRVSKKTRLYKEIYKDLFVDSNVMKFELPDMGIFKFFEDFNRNIYTKIILLIILTFMISKIISLFKVNISA